MITLTARPIVRSLNRAVLALPAALCCLAPASLSGQHVSEKILKKPPYYIGRRIEPGAVVRYLPVTYDPDGSEDAGFVPRETPGGPVAELLHSLNRQLDSLLAGMALAPVTAEPGGAPDIFFGCMTDGAGDCVDWDDDTRVERGVQLLLKIAREPGRKWSVWLSESLAAGDASHLLLISLEVSQYWPRQVNLKGDKVVDLGSGYQVKLPWLTSIETPISVVQLVGALVDRRGRVVRIGAEGMLARRTSLMPSSEGLQALITDEDVAQLLTMRREDLTGQPLAWQAALHQLTAHLLERAS